jgi:hypothetical protein
MTQTGTKRAPLPESEPRPLKPITQEQFENTLKQLRQEATPEIPPK